jgi:predicted N-acetyltransferase YhbS
MTPAPIIRPARRADLPQVFDLLEHCFPEAPRALFVAQTEYDSTFRLRHGRVAIVHGRIAGWVRIFSRTMLERGIHMRAGGIGQVATDAGARNNGIATALMLDALEAMRRESMRASYLFTGIPGFYERVGYRTVRESFFAVPSAKAADASTSGLYDVRELRDGDLPRLVAIHHRAIAGAAGAVRRTRRQWRDAQSWLAEDAAGCLVAELRGRPVAYIRCAAREYGYQVLEAECLPQHFDAVATLIAAAARRALECGSPTIGGLVPAGTPAGAVLQSLSSKPARIQHPMMMRALVDDPAIEDAIRRDHVRFWNADRI